MNDCITLPDHHIEHAIEGAIGHGQVGVFNRSSAHLPQRFLRSLAVNIEFCRRGGQKNFRAEHHGDYLSNDIW